jgi:hypothetical protein
MMKSARASATLVGIVAALALSFAIFTPLLTHAQSDLNASIRAAIMTDPRASALTPAQIDVLVQALTVKAHALGVTAHDIAWRPSQTAPAAVSAIGPYGDAYLTLLFIMFLICGAFLVVLAAMMEHLRGDSGVAPPAPPM